MVFGEVQEQVERQEIVIASFLEGSVWKGPNIWRLKRHVIPLLNKIVDENKDEEPKILTVYHLTKVIDFDILEIVVIGYFSKLRILAIEE